MKIANGLSLLRVVIAPVLLVLLLWHPPAGTLAAAVAFFIAAVSDVLDGYFARRRRAVSKLGVFIDLTADKLLTTFVLLAFVQLQQIPVWTAAVILGREFVITGLRTIAAAEGVVISAAAWGKQKTAVTNVAILLLILRADHEHGGWLSRWPGLGGPLQVSVWLLYLAAILTITSGLMYLYAARGLLASISRGAEH